MAASAFTARTHLHLPSTIGDVPAEWSWRRLDEVSEGVFDCPHSTPRLVDSGPLIVRSQDIITSVFRTEQAAHVSEETYRERTSRAVPVRGDLLYSREGTYFGIAAEVPEGTRVCLGQRMVLIRPKVAIVDFRYLCHWLNSPIMASHIHGYRDGTVAERLNLPTIRALPILVPPLAEQTIVADILGELNGKIELNRRMIETLDSMARALYKSWFVDFDPVHAKAGGRDPGLPGPLADLFPNSFQDSGLGEIPKGWDVKALSDLCSTQYGYTASAVTESVGPKFIRVTDINKRNWIEWAHIPHCQIGAKAEAQYALRVGDIVVARMADPGKSAIIEEEIKAVFASYLVRLRTESLAHSYYVYGFLKSDRYLEYADGAKSGSVQANMNARVIVGAEIVVPPQLLMERFLGTVLPLRTRLTATVRASQSLAAVRDTLLPKLMSGAMRARSPAFN